MVNLTAPSASVSWTPRSQTGSKHQFQHAPALQQPRKVVVKPAIMVFEFTLAMINTHSTGSSVPASVSRDTTL